jgi:predicted Ser/Thr protein kinase
MSWGVLFLGGCVAVPLVLAAVVVLIVYLVRRRKPSGAEPKPPTAQPPAPPAPAARCAQCNTPLSADAPLGLCPKCVLAVGVDSQQATRTSAAPPGPPPAAAFVPPRPEELAPRFPQLEILELLGQGGMGAVYKARQPGLDRTVALKILPPGLGADPTFAERFTREARSLARLSHPNIVAVYDFGQAGDLYYFVMEYVDGVSLRQMERKERLEPRQALDVVMQVCEALQFAHDAGIVHRDIKPENILIDTKGRAKIADFGLAKLLSRVPADVTLTQPQQVMGTPAYMAPEQIEHPADVDQRADIYSLGVVFYELLTGELPLGRFQPPSQKVQVDVRLDEVVLKTLAKEPERRYQQASQVRTDVEQISRAPAAGGKPPVAAPRPGAGQASSRSWVGWVVAAAVIAGVFLMSIVLLVVIALAALFFVRPVSRTSSPPEAMGMRSEALTPMVAQLPMVELKHYPLDSLEGVITQEGVELDKTISSDGHGSLKITVDGPTVVRLFETGPITAENAPLIYQAKLRTEGLGGQAYLEMWCRLPGVGEFFSRGLNNTLTGTADWTTVETPFFLRPGQGRPDNVRLNLVITGKGTVWIDDIRLLKDLSQVPAQ